MTQTLSEIVSSALRQADASIKVASLRDAPIEDRSFARVDEYLATELGQVEAETQKQASAPAGPPPEDFSGYDDVQFAFKLAEALEHGAVLVEKLAGPLNKSDGGAPNPGGGQKEGPAPLYPQPLETGVTVTPIPQASAHARRAQANTRLEPSGNPETDRSMQLNDGPVIPSQYPNSRLPTTGKVTKHAYDRQIMERMLRSKKAQYDILVSLGQIDAANTVAKEAAELSNVGAAGPLERVGADHEQSDLVFKDTYMAARFPDNEGVRNMTKAQARDANQREAGGFFGEPVKRDNAVIAHTMTAEGLKLSQVPIAALYKQATPTPGAFSNAVKRTGELFSGSKLKSLRGHAEGLGQRLKDPLESGAHAARNAVDDFGNMIPNSAVGGATDNAGNTVRNLAGRHQDAVAAAQAERNKVYGTRAGAGLAGAGAVYGLSRDKKSSDGGALSRFGRRAKELVSGSKARGLHGEMEGYAKRLKEPGEQYAHRAPVDDFGNAVKGHVRGHSTDDAGNTVRNLHGSHQDTQKAYRSERNKVYGTRGGIAVGAGGAGYGALRSRKGDRR